METIRYENKWPNYNEIVHISNDGLCTISICDNDIDGFGFIYNWLYTKRHVIKDAANTCWIWRNWK